MIKAPHKSQQDKSSTHLVDPRSHETMCSKSSTRKKLGVMKDHLTDVSSWDSPEWQHRPALPELRRPRYLHCHVEVRLGYKSKTLSQKKERNQNSLVNLISQEPSQLWLYSNNKSIELMEKSARVGKTGHAEQLLGEQCWLAHPSPLSEIQEPNHTVSYFGVRHLPVLLSLSQYFFSLLICRCAHILKSSSVHRH